MKLKFIGVIAIVVLTISVLSACGSTKQELYGKVSTQKNIEDKANKAISSDESSMSSQSSSISSSTSTNVSTNTSSSTQDIQGTEMNLPQIQAGNYSSLLGTWTEVAYAGNYYDGTGVQWKTGSISTLSVSSDKIVLNDLVIQGNTLKDSAGSHTLEFEINGGSLDASLKDQSVAINWAVYFYPKGVKNDLEPNNGVKIDNTKNLIVIWSSNMNQTVVFAQTMK